MAKDRAAELKEGFFRTGIWVRGKVNDADQAEFTARELEALSAENVGGYGMKRVGGKWTKPRGK